MVVSCLRLKLSGNLPGRPHHGFNKLLQRFRIGACSGHTQTDGGNDLRPLIEGGADAGDADIVLILFDGITVGLRLFMNFSKLLKIDNCFSCAGDQSGSRDQRIPGFVRQL